MISLKMTNCNLAVKRVYFHMQYPFSIPFVDADVQQRRDYPSEEIVWKVTFSAFLIPSSNLPKQPQEDQLHPY